MRQTKYGERTASSADSPGQQQQKNKKDQRLDNSLT